MIICTFDDISIIDPHMHGANYFIKIVNHPSKYSIHRKDRSVQLTKYGHNGVDMY